MENIFSEESYSRMISALFVRFPSFQKDGASAYKPGIANMEFFDQLVGHPHRSYRVIHVAGTNGKGSVSNMLASVLAASGMKVGLYTSPHIEDFRERIRYISPDSPVQMIGRRQVWDFVDRWSETFDHLDLSFFEITTMMALDWFAKVNVDVAVIETGLGGRLDSTNIVSSDLSVITNIGLDHCDMLGSTLPEIAFEKAGIIKPLVPVVVGESHTQTDEVFERKVLYTNLPEPAFMGDRKRIMSLLTFADKTEPSMWRSHQEILRDMDLQGEYQRHNLRTVLASLDVLKTMDGFSSCLTDVGVQKDAISRTASRMNFHGRWEKLSDDPHVICDIGHNEHGLKYNFAQLQEMISSGRFTELIIVYGSVADKDVTSVTGIMPSDAVYIFTKAKGKRSMEAEAIRDIYISSNGQKSRCIHCVPDVAEAVKKALSLAEDMNAAGKSPLVYIGGSTYVVSEAVEILGDKNQ